MRWPILLSIVFVSAFAATGFVVIKNHQTSLDQANLANQICTAVAPRVQIGAIRDAYDQAYAILKISSASEKHLLSLKDGKAEYGRRPHNETQFRSEICTVEGRPDFELISYFEHLPLLGVNWFMAFAFTITLMMLGAFAFTLISEHLVRIVESVFEKEFWGRSTKKSGRVAAALELLLGKTKAVKNLRKELEENKSLAQENAALVSFNARFKAEEKSVSDLVQQVSHDIRSPLALLKVSTHVFEGDPGPIHLALQKIENILRDLNDVAGAEIREQENLAVVECAIQEAVSAKRLSWGSAVDIRLDFDRSSLNLSPIDHGRLTRILENLLENSYEAMNGSGLIVVATWRAGDQVEIEITDRGKGIPAEILERLGSERLTFGKQTGNGVGLITAKQWVDAWGGKLSVRSQEGKGTSVSIILPRKESKARFVADLPPRKEEKIVVVDDEEIAASQLLKKAGGEGKHFSSIAAYASWLDNSSVLEQEAISVYDLHLGSGSGLDLLRIHPWPKTALLFTNDYLNPEAVSLSAELGFSIMPKAFVAQ